MTDEVERLARRLAEDVRITTRSLWRILKDIDGEIYAVSRAGTPTPEPITRLRGVVARAYLLRREQERGGRDDVLPTR